MENKQKNKFLFFPKSNNINPKIKTLIQTEIYGIKSMSIVKNEIIENMVVIVITFTKVYQFILYHLDASLWAYHLENLKHINLAGAAGKAAVTEHRAQRLFAGNLFDHIF